MYEFENRMIYLKINSMIINNYYFHDIFLYRKLLNILIVSLFNHLFLCNKQNKTRSSICVIDYTQYSHLISCKKINSMFYQNQIIDIIRQLVYESFDFGPFNLQSYIQRDFNNEKQVVLSDFGFKRLLRSLRRLPLPSHSAIIEQCSAISFQVQFVSLTKMADISKEDLRKEIAGKWYFFVYFISRSCETLKTKHVIFFSTFFLYAFFSVISKNRGVFSCTIFGLSIRYKQWLNDAGPLDYILCCCKFKIFSKSTLRRNIYLGQNRCKKLFVIFVGRSLPGFFSI